MKKNLFVTIAFLLAFTFSYSQTYRYKIISNGQVVGELTATQISSEGQSTQTPSEDEPAQTANANQKTINIMSEFDVHLFISVHVKYEMKCKYIDGVLVESSVETYKDNDLHSSSKGEKINDTYKVVADGDVLTHEGDIAYSGGMLYFKEPQGLSNIFSEIHAREKPVKKVNESHFMVTDPKTGQSNQYFYIYP